MTTDSLTIPADTKDTTVPLSPEQVKLRNDALLPIAQTLAERVVSLQSQGINVPEDVVNAAAQKVANMPLYTGPNANENNKALNSFVQQNLFTVQDKNATLNTAGLDALAVAIENLPAKSVPANEPPKDELPTPAPTAVTVNSNNTNIEANVDNSTNTTVIEGKKEEPPAQPIQINTANTSLTTTETNIDNSTTVVEAPAISETDSVKKDEPAPPVNAAAAAIETTIDDSPNATVHQTVIVHNAPQDTPPTLADTGASQPEQPAPAPKDTTVDVSARQTDKDQPTESVPAFNASLAAPQTATITTTEEIPAHAKEHGDTAMNLKISGAILAVGAGLAMIAAAAFTPLAGVLLAGAAISYAAGKIKEVRDNIPEPAHTETRVTTVPVAQGAPTPDLPQHDLERSDGKSWVAATETQKPAPLKAPAESWTQQATAQDAATAQATVRC